MSDGLEIRGVCPDRFSAVRDAFAANFAEGAELGARFSAAIDGKVIVDLMAGWADRAMSVPFGPDTLAPVFSTTKAVTAMMIARLVSQGRLAYEQRVAEVWPEFGQAGKAGITVEQCLSHQDGLAAFTEPMDPELWFDWGAITARIAALAPLWPPGTASGYHPVIYGYVVGEDQGSRKARRLIAVSSPRSGMAEGRCIPATRPCSESGRPIQISSPSGRARSSRRAVPRVRPSTRRKISPTT